MPRKFIKRWLPEHKTIKEHKSLQFLGTLLHDPNLLHVNRRSITGGVTVGLFCAFVPIPMQMILAAIVSIWLRTNLPVSVALVWITNPITIPPIFFFCYKLGAWILGTPIMDVEFEASWAWVLGEMQHIGVPFLFGCLVMAVGSAALGNITVRLLWRLVVVRSWQERLRKRADRPKD